MGFITWSLRSRTLNRRWKRSKQVEQSLQDLALGEIEGRDSRKEVAKNLVQTLIGAVLGIIASNRSTICHWLVQLPLFNR